MPAIEKKWTFPGFVDVHVHFRDPGDARAETVESGLLAARHGGFRAVVTMPNTTPACDSPEVLEYQRQRWKEAREHQGVSSETFPPFHSSTFQPSHLSTLPLLLPSACLTRGRLGREVADLEALAASGAVFFTDDGAFVEDAKVMEEACRRAAALGLVVSQHALCPAMSEADCIRRDLSICRVTGCRYHVQHLSTAEGVDLVRTAQREGLPVTAEATPHHVLLCADDRRGDDGNFKMAPPLATKEDRAAVREAVKEGAFMFATDHAPHRAETKNCGYAKAANGIVGLETAIPITYHALVEEEGMSVEKWAEAWWKKPREILPANVEIRGETEVVLFGEPRAVRVESFLSRSRNCPYDGLRFRAWPHV